MNYSFEEFFEKNKKNKNKKIKEISGKLWRAYQEIKEKLEKQLENSKVYFPHYSSHDKRHSENIIIQVEKMLGEEHWKTITVTDAWMFLCCAYIHDIGMLITYEELERDWREAEFQSFLKECTSSSDSSIQIAAEHMLGGISNIEQSSLTWPIIIRKEVMFLTSEFYRRKHSDRVEEVMEQNLKNFLNEVLSPEKGFPSRIQKQIAKICSMHGATFEYMIEYLPNKDTVLDEEYSPKLVAILLRLGDLCDFDNDRFDILWIKANGGLTHTNLIHYYKHQSVATKAITSKEISVVLNVDFDRIRKEIAGEKEIEGLGKIEEKQQKKDMASQHDFCNQIVVEINNWFNWLEEELNNMRSKWKQITDYKIPLDLILSKKIKINDKECTFAEKNIRFTFSNEKAYTLIEGYSLYDDQLIFVREFIQNSLDALKLKFWHDLRAGLYDEWIEKDCKQDITKENGTIDYSKLQPFSFKGNEIYKIYQIKIKIDYKQGENIARFIIEDNGIGISIHDLENKIVNTGSSWKKNEYKTDMEGMPIWLYPTGAFGIGLHSAFSLSDCIYIQTKPENDTKTYEITLHSGKKDGYVLASECSKDITFCEKRGSGTRMELIIDLKKYEGKEEKQETNPFEERPESSFCFEVVNKIETFCRLPLFEIQYQYENKRNTISTFAESKEFQILFQKEQQIMFHKEVFPKSEEYNFAWEDYGREIVLWDKLKGIAARFTFNTILKSECFCKGIFAQNADINNDLPWLHIASIDILGGECNDIITVARDNIKQKYKGILKQLLWKYNEWIADLYCVLLLELYNKKEIQNWLGELEIAIEKQLQQKEEADIHWCKEFIELRKKYGTLEEKKENILMISSLHLYYIIITRIGDNFRKYLIENREEMKLNIKYGKKYAKSAFQSIEKTSFFYILKKLIIYKWKGEFKAEFISTFESAFGIEFEGDFVREFGSNFVREFGKKFEREFESAFEMEVGMEVESNFESEFVKDFGRESIIYLLKDEISINIVESLKDNDMKIFYSLPLYQIIWMNLVLKQDTIQELKKIIEDKRISIRPGFYNGYGFIDKNNIIQILTATTLEIPYQKYFFAKKKLVYLNFIPCETLAYENKELILKFDIQNKEKRPIKNSTIFLLKKYIEKNIENKILPAFEKYKTITTKLSSNNYNILQCNYELIVWNEFLEIKKNQIKSEEEKEKMIENLMNGVGEDGKRVQNIIRYIYRNRVYIDENETYEVTMKKIRDNYREFISDILDCTWLSDEELKRKKV